MSLIMRGHLKLMILNTLGNESLTGSQIMAKLEKNTGWKPSCGSIYPVLNSLEKEKLTARIRKGNSTQKIYSLTKKGKDELKLHNSNKEALLNEIVKVHKMIESTYGINLKLNEKELTEEIKNTLQSSGIFYKNFRSESDAMKKELMSLINGGLSEAKIREIKVIMNESTQKYRKLRIAGKTAQKVQN